MKFSKKYLFLKSYTFFSAFIFILNCFPIDSFLFAFFSITAFFLFSTYLLMTATVLVRGQGSIVPASLYNSSLQPFCTMDWTRVRTFSTHAQNKQKKHSVRITPPRLLSRFISDRWILNKKLPCSKHRRVMHVYIMYRYEITWPNCSGQWELMGLGNTPAI